MKMNHKQKKLSKKKEKKYDIELMKENLGMRKTIAKYVASSMGVLQNQLEILYTIDKIDGCVIVCEFISNQTSNSSCLALCFFLVFFQICFFCFFLYFLSEKQTTISQQTKTKHG